MRQEQIKALIDAGTKAINESAQSEEFRQYMDKIRHDPKFIEMCAEVERRIAS